MERKAQAIKMELDAAQAQNHPDLPVIQAIYDDFAKIMTLTQVNGRNAISWKEKFDWMTGRSG